VTGAAVEYTIDVQPRQAVLGEPVLALLSCRAAAPATGALMFGHRSLVVEVNRQGLIEPRLAFPNRQSVERGGQLIRTYAPGGVEDLQPGEERTRSFDLLAPFPDVVLAPGTFTVTYRLEEADPIVRPAPIEVEVRSGPAAVPRLIGLLSADSAATRFRAAELLTAMAADELGYRADDEEAARGEAIQRWWAWWHDAGSQLPWSFESEGATFGRPPGPAPDSGLGARLGGIAYPQRPTPAS
jgi:hypothetical protein